MDPIIEEMQRAHLPIQSHVWAHWMNYLATDVQPRLDRLEELERQRERFQAQEPAASFIATARVKR